MAALLLPLISLAAAHGDEDIDGKHGAMKMGGMHNSTPPAQIDPLYALPSYAGHNSYTGSILAHIILESIAWFFVLPIGAQLHRSMSHID